MLQAMIINFLLINLWILKRGIIASMPPFCVSLQTTGMWMWMGRRDGFPVTSWVWWRIDRGKCPGIPACQCQWVALMRCLRTPVISQTPKVCCTSTYKTRSCPKTNMHFVRSSTYVASVGYRANHYRAISSLQNVYMLSVCICSGY